MNTAAVVFIRGSPRRHWPRSNPSTCGRGKTLMASERDAHRRRIVTWNRKRRRKQEGCRSGTTTTHRGCPYRAVPAAARVASPSIIWAIAAVPPVPIVAAPVRPIAIARITPEPVISEPEPSPPEGAVAISPPWRGHHPHRDLGARAFIVAAVGLPHERGVFGKRLTT